MFIALAPDLKFFECQANKGFLLKEFDRQPKQTQNDHL